MKCMSISATGGKCKKHVVKYVVAYHFWRGWDTPGALIITNLPSPVGGASALHHNAISEAVSQRDEENPPPPLFSPAHVSLSFSVSSQHVRTNFVGCLIGHKPRLNPHAAACYLFFMSQWGGVDSSEQLSGKFFFYCCFLLFLKKNVFFN